MKVAIAGLNHPAASKDLGIVQNPLPNHQSTPTVQDPSSSNSQEQTARVTTFTLTGEVIGLRREQTWSYEDEEPESPVHRSKPIRTEVEPEVAIIVEQGNQIRFEEPNRPLVLLRPERVMADPVPQLIKPVRSEVRS